MTRVAPLFFVCCLASATASAGPSGDKWAEWPDNPNPTRLLVGPTARSLDQGQVYLDSFGISLPFVQVGITNRVSMGAGGAAALSGRHAWRRLLAHSEGAGLPGRAEPGRRRRFSREGR